MSAQASPKYASAKLAHLSWRLILKCAVNFTSFYINAGSITYSILPNDWESRLKAHIKTYKLVNFVIVKSSYMRGNVTSCANYRIAFPLHPIGSHHTISSNVRSGSEMNINVWLLDSFHVRVSRGNSSAVHWKVGQYAYNFPFISICSLPSGKLRRDSPFKILSSLIISRIRFSVFAAKAFCSGVPRIL
jgi:hypothetical protein